jgi:hypothetical protein
MYPAAGECQAGHDSRQFSIFSTILKERGCFATHQSRQDDAETTWSAEAAEW